MGDTIILIPSSLQLRSHDLTRDLPSWLEEARTALRTSCPDTTREYIGIGLSLLALNLINCKQQPNEFSPCIEFLPDWNTVQKAAWCWPPEQLKILLPQSW
jgi:hypothetical protein